MKLNRIYITILLLACFSGPLFGQKKKPQSNNVQASATKLREAEFYFTEAEKFFILEDYSKALTYYQKCLELAPGNATVHYKIAEVLVQSNRPEDLQKAAFSIDNALRLEKKNKYFYLLGANIYTSLTRFDKAAQIYEAMIAEVKGTEEYLYELAAVYQFWNKPDEAIRAYQRAENLLGVNEISSLQKQKLYLEQGKTKDALAEGEKLVAAFPGDERLVMSFTELLSQKGLKAEAVQYLQKFVTENPEAVNTQMLLAAFYREFNEEEKARPLLLSLFDNAEVDVHSKILIMSAYNAELNLARMKSSVDQEKFRFAEKLFLRLANAGIEEVNINIIGGDLYLSGGKFREAQGYYTKAVKSGNVNFEVWENLLNLDHQLEDYEKILSHSDMALELFPNHGLFHYFNGVGNLKKKNLAEAISSFEQAKRLSASNSMLMSEISAMLGEAYHYMGSFDKSEKAFEEALAFNASNYTALSNYSYLLASRKTNLDKAERMAAQLVKDHPDNAAFLDTYSWVLFTRGKYKDARKHIEKAIGTGKATARHFEHYGDILYRLGEIDAAVIQWEKARGFNVNNEALDRKIANRTMYE